MPGGSWLRRPRNGGEAGAYQPPSSQAWTTGPGPHSAGSAPRGRLPGPRPLPFTLSLLFLGSAGSVGRGLLPGASTPARTADLPSLRSPAVGESQELLSAALRICSHTALPGCSGGRGQCAGCHPFSGRRRAEPGGEEVLKEPCLRPPWTPCCRSLRHTRCDIKSRRPGARLEGQERKQDSGKTAPHTPPGESGGN